MSSTLPQPVGRMTWAAIPISASPFFCNGAIRTTLQSQTPSTKHILRQEFSVESKQPHIEVTRLLGLED